MVGPNVQAPVCGRRHRKANAGTLRSFRGAARSVQYAECISGSTGPGYRAPKPHFGLFVRASNSGLLQTYSTSVSNQRFYIKRKIQNIIISSLIRHETILS